jgi:hypothetical protein
LQLTLNAPVTTAAATGAPAALLRSKEYRWTGSVVDARMPALTSTRGLCAVGCVRAAARPRAGLLDHCKPEFINRLDDIVRFRSRTREQISEIVELEKTLLGC